MTTSPNFGVSHIEGIALIVADLDAAINFYQDGLGFTLKARADVPGSKASAVLSLGGVSLQLDQPALPGKPYPCKRSANDPWFQHFAIRVSNMDLAYARLARQPITHISVGGPQQLSSSSGSVIAYKFRDIDGHPLELSQYPGEVPPSSESPFLAIDHSAIAVKDLQASIAFYSGQLGFRVAETLVNQGPAQCRLDGLDDVVVDIVVLATPFPGPHLELLHYRSPAPSLAVQGTELNDIATTRLLVTAEGPGRILPDPDRHFVAVV